MATSEVDVEKLVVAAPELVASILLLPDSNIVGRMHWSKKTVVPFAVLTGVQLLFNGNQILAKVALVSGLDSLFFSFYRNLVAFLFLAPVAFFLDRDVRPLMTLGTFGSFNLLAFFGILGKQQMFLVGLKLTSPLFTAVVQNMVPVITFLLAALAGMEKISFWKKSDHVRMVGTMICITGAVVMSLCKGIVIFTKKTKQEELHGFISMDMVRQLENLEIGHWIVGVVCLLINHTLWALYLII